MKEMQQLKILAAKKAIQFVEEGMYLGIGTGSTVEEFIQILGKKILRGFSIFCVPTSQRTEQYCRTLSIPTVNLDEISELDLTIDGADEIDSKLNLIKGGGGALLREKIIAAASKEVLIIADERKFVKILGCYPLPIEVNPFGLQSTTKLIQKTVFDEFSKNNIKLRIKNDTPFTTDGGNFILDVYFNNIPSPYLLSEKLLMIPGVIEHGLFLNLASHAIIAYQNGEIKIFESKF